MIQHRKTFNLCIYCKLFEEVLREEFPFPNTKKHLQSLFLSNFNIQNFVMQTRLTLEYNLLV